MTGPLKKGARKKDCTSLHKRNIENYFRAVTLSSQPSAGLLWIPVSIC